MSAESIVAPDITDRTEMRRLASVFDHGRLIAIPTETVYGLAAPIDRPELVERIFALKGRPPDHPLIVHVASRAQARVCVSDWPEVADILASHFWPGPLTLVLPRSAAISDRITAGQNTVALRMPDHPVALALIEALDSPVVAPSANLFTRLSPTSAADVTEAFPASEVLVLDGGRCRVGIESTIVAVDEMTQTLWWLRPGQVDRGQLAALLPPGWRLSPPADEADSTQPAAPGGMLIHYRPGKPLRVTVVAGQAGLQGLRQRLHADPETTVVELPDQPAQAARELYAALRRADAQPGQFIDLIIPSERLDDAAWEGVANRLRKSASEWTRLDG
ncbi:L-threonylcarbamoyladenylate synthase [Wenzhouxiangella limi]|uniref:Threonylcarbamoyl-AMP synthase n=1 Tax=Wenzhouxiangella limi TaxID=2707351 RepID=A0A845V3G8_9GAMM|nr:threonylcarbamoyl-AMP synthase [Wenzhouxiangella limi]